jgi:peptidoglycan/LPS O-acetylase OafA/YrhL
VPLVNAGVRRARGRAGRLAVVLVLPVALTLAGVAYLVWETLWWSEPSVENYSVLFHPLSRAADFGIGTGLAVLAASGVRLGSPARAATALLGVAALGGLIATRPHEVVGEWWHPAYALAIAIGLTALVLHDGPWPAVLEWRPLAWIGGLGYGVYLIHEPVMRVLASAGLLPEARPGAWFFLTAVLVLVPTVWLARLSSRTVETAGARLAATIDSRGRPRDYYAHLRAESRPG